MIYGDFIVINGDLMGFNGIYPLVIADVAIENGPVEIVSFPINSIW